LYHIFIYAPVLCKIKTKNSTLVKILALTNTLCRSWETNCQSAFFPLFSGS